VFPDKESPSQFDAGIVKKDHLWMETS